MGIKDNYQLITLIASRASSKWINHTESLLSTKKMAINGTLKDTT